MTIQFGEALRQEREARGLQIEDMCAATKISVQNALALEAGEIGRLPGGVFRRGIVRSYLDALGLPEAVWMDRFEASCRDLGLGEAGTRDWVQFAENVKRGRGEERRSLDWRWVGLALLVVGLGAMAWMAWHFVLHPRLEHRTFARYVAASRAGATVHADHAGACQRSPAAVQRQFHRLC